MGDYYTDKEYRKLREEQRQEYCQELAEQDSIYREEIAEARIAEERFAARAANARASADSVGRLADSLEAMLAAARPRTRHPSEELPATAPGEGPGESATAGGAARVTVREGDSLWCISARESVYGEGREWPKLYEANRNRIRDANRIFPGQELSVPR